MTKTCSWKGCNEPRNKNEVYCLEHRREYQRKWRKGLLVKKLYPAPRVEYNPVSDYQATLVWRKAYQGLFGSDSETIMKLAEDVMTWNAERRLTMREPDLSKAGQNSQQGNNQSVVSEPA